MLLKLNNTGDDGLLALSINIHTLPSIDAHPAATTDPHHPDRVLLLLTFQVSLESASHKRLKNFIRVTYSIFRRSVIYPDRYHAAFARESISEVKCRPICYNSISAAITAQNLSRKKIQAWLRDNQIKTLYIDPGNPWENGYIESFNSRCRDECLNRKWLLNLCKARVII